MLFIAADKESLSLYLKPSLLLLKLTMVSILIVSLPELVLLLFLFLVFVSTTHMSLLIVLQV